MIEIEGTIEDYDAKIFKRYNTTFIGGSSTTALWFPQPVFSYIKPDKKSH